MGAGTFIVGAAAGAAGLYAVENRTSLLTKLRGSAVRTKALPAKPDDARDVPADSVPGADGRPLVVGAAAVDRKRPSWKVTVVDAGYREAPGRKPTPYVTVRHEDGEEFTVPASFYKAAGPGGKKKRRRSR